MDGWRKLTYWYQNRCMNVLHICCLWLILCMMFRFSLVFTSPSMVVGEIFTICSCPISKGRASSSWIHKRWLQGAGYLSCVHKMFRRIVSNMKTAGPCKPYVLSHAHHLDVELFSPASILSTLAGRVHLNHTWRIGNLPCGNPSCSTVPIPGSVTETSNEAVVPQGDEARKEAGAEKQSWDFQNPGKETTWYNI